MTIKELIAKLEEAESTNDDLGALALEHLRNILRSMEFFDSNGVDISVSARKGQPLKLTLKNASLCKPKNS